MTWDVLVVLTDDGKCPVLDFLNGLDPSYRVARLGMLALLREVVPTHGPFLRMPLQKPLQNGLHEFRKNPGGKKLRVIWFTGGNSSVICAEACQKEAKLPIISLNRAADWQARYRRDESSNRNQVSDLDVSEDKPWRWTLTKS